MELRLYFEDYENAVEDGDGDYSVPTIEEFIADADDEALRSALLRMAEKLEMDPTAVLVHANGGDFVQFYVLDKEEPAAPLTNEGIEGPGNLRDHPRRRSQPRKRPPHSRCRRIYATSNTASASRAKSTRSFLPKS